MLFPNGRKRSPMSCDRLFRKWKRRLHFRRIHADGRLIVEGMRRGDGFRMERPVLQGEREIRRPILCAVAVFICEGVPLYAIDAVHAHRYVVRHHDIRFGACIGP